MQAFAEGRVIECRTKLSAIKGSDVPNDWTEMKEIEFWNNIEYRVKPEPKYRPFANAEECIEEMKKHVPFSWVKDKYSFYPIEMIADSFGKECIKCYGTWFTPEKMFKDATFLDGTPFGILEED